MGNIHGGCLNVDRLERDGSTYRGIECPDFLTANDAWFMPVVQKTGPDGCLYVLDWYDRYHCYQDAGRDPKGIDRLKGRLYRIRYQNTPRAAPFDLAKESDEQLIARLSSPNVFYRDLAQRLLVGAEPRRNPAAARSDRARRSRAASGADARPVGAGRHRRARCLVSSPFAGSCRFGAAGLGRAGGRQFPATCSPKSCRRCWAWRPIRPPTCGCKSPSPRAKLNGVDPAPVLLQVLTAGEATN